jgi:hypothetical protein
MDSKKPKRGLTMKNLIFVPIIMLSLLIGGCGSGETAGLITAGGFAAKHTLDGIEADLAEREQQLVDRYNAAVKAGAKQEVLDDLEKQIDKTAVLREGVTEGKKLFGVDWNDPRDAGTSIAKLGVLAYLFFTKRKLLKTEKGVNKFMANTDKVTANKIYDKILRQT